MLNIVKKKLNFSSIAFEIYEFYDEFLLFYDDITIQMLFYE
jgi:hypothetical protein